MNKTFSAYDVQQVVHHGLLALKEGLITYWELAMRWHYDVGLSFKEIQTLLAD